MHRTRRLATATLAVASLTLPQDAAGASPARQDRHSQVAEAAWPGKQAARELMLERTFSVQPGGTLAIDLGDGDVTVTTASVRQATVKAYVGSQDPEWKRSVFEQMRFDVRMDGGRLVVRADNPQIERHWRRGRGVWVGIEIVIPESFDAEIDTDDGDVELADVSGRVKLRTGDGDVRIERVRGSEISVRTADGDIHAETLEGSEVTLDTGDGDVVVRDMTGPLRVTTGDGDIRLHVTRAGETRLRTGDGDITIYADRSLSADVDLYGEDLVLDGFQVEGRITRRGARGRLNGGGPLLEARTRDGTVALRRR